MSLSSLSRPLAMHVATRDWGLQVANFQPVAGLIMAFFQVLFNARSRLHPSFHPGAFLQVLIDRAWIEQNPTMVLESWKDLGPTVLPWEPRDPLRAECPTWSSEVFAWKFCSACCSDASSSFFSAVQLCFRVQQSGSPGCDRCKNRSANCSSLSAPTVSCVIFAFMERSDCCCDASARSVLRCHRWSTALVLLSPDLPHLWRGKGSTLGLTQRGAGAGAGNGWGHGPLGSWHPRAGPVHQGKLRADWAAHRQFNSVA